MTLKSLPPEAVDAFLAQGAMRFDDATAVIFYCRSGARTQMNAQLTVSPSFYAMPGSSMPGWCLQERRVLAVWRAC